MPLTRRLLHLTQKKDLPQRPEAAQIFTCSRKDTRVSKKTLSSLKRGSLRNSVEIVAVLAITYTSSPGGEHHIISRSARANHSSLLELHRFNSSRPARAIHSSLLKLHHFNFSRSARATSFITAQAAPLIIHSKSAGASSLSPLKLHRRHLY